ncbi:hypothetical protein AB4097_20665 [Microvirga sp. 2MCAF35]|uniref:hypothetical protein n=1 Tax=Microvirga sp. 2MCAF35 TaxID=3232987 RepID=UPI003F9DC544
MWIIGGLVGGVVWTLFRPLFKSLVILAVMLYGCNWLTSDPIQVKHEMELRNQEYASVQDQKRKVLAQDLQIVWEKYGDREAVVTIQNGSVARISDLQLNCSYERPDEDEPWKLTTPVASTGFINPGESKRISFWLRDAASDAIPSSFACDPVMTLDEGGLMRAKILQPKNSGDRLLAQTDISLTAQVGDRRKIDRREIIAEGIIANRSSKAVTAINLICQGLVNPLGLVRSVGGFTNLYVRPGTTERFSFQVGLIQEMDPKWGIKDLACRVLTVEDS